MEDTADAADTADTADAARTARTAEGTAADTGAPVGTGEAVDRPKTLRPGLQLAAAAVVLGGFLAALWGLGCMDGSTDPHAEPVAKPAECAAPRPTDPPGYPALCAALNRPDLPSLLGTPEDRVSTAHPAPIVFGKDVMVEVRLKLSVVSLMDSNTSVDDMVGMPQFFAQPTTVLGHPAVTYRSSASYIFAPGKAGPSTRNLVVAQDPKAPGGRAYELAVFRQDERNPDEAALNRLAEALLPTLPGWVAAP
ncbi:DUF6215 domain-containing protein [Kitasatospora sp. NPDC093550]|uniref:DUF6215 domain-containing protein n=1 Tax=Kitasatospora sp. NPDC093550 TaxID=3364089 RepID=UPI0037F47C52